MVNSIVHKINPYIIRSGYMKECPPSGTRYGERTVKWFELELITEGSGCVITQGKKIPATRGTIFYRKPGMKVEGISPYFCYLIVFDICFDSKLIDEYSKSEVLKASNNNIEFMRKRYGQGFDSILDFPYAFEVKEFEYYDKIFSDLHLNYFDRTNDAVLSNKIKLLNLISSLKQNLVPNKIVSGKKLSINNNFDKVMKVKKHLDSCITQDVNLSFLAEIAGLSPNFLCKIFKEIIGQSPMTYYNSIKIQKACHLLTDTEKSISEIAYGCGFENDTYFYTLFKKTTGHTPSQYRSSKLVFFK